MICPLIVSIGSGILAEEFLKIDISAFFVSNAREESGRFRI